MFRNSLKTLSKAAVSNSFRPGYFQPKFVFFTIKNSKKVEPLLLSKPTSIKRLISSWIQKLKEYKFPKYTYLIGANVLIYLAWNSRIISKKFLQDHFTLSKYTIAKNHLHTMITYSFSHFQMMHLILNMLMVYFFGSVIEKQFGGKNLIRLYLVGAFMAAIFIVSQNNRRKHNVTHIGASGATSALLSFYMMNFPKSKILVFLFPVKAWIVGGFIFAYSLINYEKQNGISHSGHLGGFIGGLGMYFHLRGRIF